MADEVVTLRQFEVWASKQSGGGGCLYSSVNP